MFIYSVPFLLKGYSCSNADNISFKRKYFIWEHIRLWYRKLQTIHGETAITKTYETCPDEKKNHLTEMIKQLNIWMQAEMKNQKQCLSMQFFVHHYCMSGNFSHAKRYRTEISGNRFRSSGMPRHICSLKNTIPDQP